MFEYKSIQSHSEFNRGVGKTKINEVNIKGKKGFKSITIKNKSGKTVKKSKRRLTQKEIKCIQNCQFIPGLFKDCQKCLK